MCAHTTQVQRNVDGLSFVCKQVVCENICGANYALKEAKTLQVCKCVRGEIEHARTHIGTHESLLVYRF